MDVIVGSQASNPNPVAINDNVSTPVNTPIDILVLLNDSDTSGQVLSVSGYTQ